MPGPTTHPTFDAIAAFADGVLPDAEASEVEAHVAECESCLRQLVEQPEHPLAGLLPGAPEPGPARPAAQDTGVSAGQTLTERPAPAAAEVPAELVGHPRYKVLGTLGRGGMGAVYLAEHLKMGRRVALKVVRPELLGRPDALSRFQQEVRAAARLTHPNIVRALDADEAGGLHFLVMEYVEGTDLARRLEQGGPLPAALACEYARQAALGLQHAHEHGMVHRDVKPHNLMLTPEGQVKILDFGLARFAQDQANRGEGQLTGSGVVLGSADYVAPEQTRDAHQTDARSDVYSLGCTLYHLLSGRVPFAQGTAVDKMLRHTLDAPPPLAELRPDLPAGLAAVVERMMAKEPSQRYQTPAKVAEALAPFTRPAAKTRPITRRRWPSVAVAVAAAAVAAVLLGAAVYRIQTDQGELVIRTESDDVEVVVKQGGRVVRVVDTKTDKEIKLTLDSGAYQLELQGAPEGLKLSIDRATLTRGKQTLATIERKAQEPARIELLQRIPISAAGNLFYDVDISEGGKYALVTRDISPGCQLVLFNARTGDRLYDRHGYLARFLDGEHLVVDADGMFRVYEAKSGKQLREGRHGDIWGMVVAPRGKHLVYQANNRFALFDLTDMTEKHAWQKQSSGAAGLDFSADGRRAIMRLNEDDAWVVWDVENDREAEDFAWLKKEPRPQFLPDGKTVLTCRDGKYVRADAATGRVLETLRPVEPPPGLQSWAVVRRGRFLLAGFDDATVRLYPLTTSQELARYQLPSDDCIRPDAAGWHSCVAVSGDDQYAAVVTRHSLWVFRLPPVPTSNNSP